MQNNINYLQNNRNIASLLRTSIPEDVRLQTLEETHIMYPCLDCSIGTRKGKWDIRMRQDLKKETVDGVTLNFPDGFCAVYNGNNSRMTLVLGSDAEMFKDSIDTFTKKILEPRFPYLPKENKNDSHYLHWFIIGNLGAGLGIGTGIAGIDNAYDLGIIPALKDAAQYVIGPHTYSSIHDIINAPTLEQYVLGGVLIGVFRDPIQDFLTVLSNKIARSADRHRVCKLDNAVLEFRYGPEAMNEIHQEYAKVSGEKDTMQFIRI